MWVTCTYNLKPGSVRKSTRTPKWVTGCDDQAQAELVQAMLRKLPLYFSYIRERDHEPQYEKRRYQVSMTDGRETTKFLAMKIEEA